MDNLFQLRSKNDKSIKQLDAESRELIRSLVSYMSQYEVTRYELEEIKMELIAKAHSYQKRNTSLFKEIKEISAYCATLKAKYNLERISLKNLLLVEYLPMIGFFFMLVILILHFVSLWFSGAGLITSIDVAVGYPIFMLVQYLSIVYLLYLERRYAIENKSRKNLGSFANIFLVLTVIQYISDSPTLLRPLIQLNLFVLVGIIIAFLGWVIYKELQTK